MSNHSTQYIDVDTIGKGLSMVSLNSFQQLMKEHNTNHPPNTSKPHPLYGDSSHSTPRGAELESAHPSPLTTPNRSVGASEIMGSRYLREYDEFESCGFGTYGTVHRVRHKLDCAEYAIKKVLYKHDGVNHDHIKDKLLREVTTIARFNHVNVVRYFTAWIEAMPATVSATNRSNSTLISPEHHRQSQERDDGNLYDAAFHGQYDESLNVPNLPDVNVHDVHGVQSVHSVHDIDPNYSAVAISKHDAIFNFWQKKEHYSCLYLQTEYCGNYALHQFIHESNRVPDREDNMHLFSQMLLGAAHIHSKGLLHRDLKPENIFLVSNSVDGDHRDARQLTVKIGDFGLSKSISESIVDPDSAEFKVDFQSYDFSNNLTANLGTEVYAAPEQLSSDNGGYDTAADIYSLGVILFELVQPPFVTMTERRMAIARFRNQHEIDGDRIDTVLFQKEIKLMLEMTHKDPAKRPTANQLIHYPFIAEFWIKNVLNGAIPPIPVGTHSALQHDRHCSIEYERHSDGENGNDRPNDRSVPDEVSRPALHHCESIQVKSVVQSSEDTDSGSECKGSPVYLVTSPCGSPQEVTVPNCPQMSPFCIDENENKDTSLLKQSMEKEHRH